MTPIILGESGITAPEAILGFLAVLAGLALAIGLLMLIVKWVCLPYMLEKKLTLIDGRLESLERVLGRAEISHAETGAES